MIVRYRKLQQKVKEDSSKESDCIKSSNEMLEADIKSDGSEKKSESDSPNRS